YQSVPGDVGPECLPSGLSAVRGVRHQAVLPAGGRDRHSETMRTICFAFATTTLVAVLTALVAAGQAGTPSSPGPVIVVETTKGTFAFETYPRDAPKTVGHVVALVRRGFYDGQRVHRAIPGFLVQWGDPQSRDPAREADWGRGAAASSGQPIGTAEISRRLHVVGAVAMAHPG